MEFLYRIKVPLALLVAVILGGIALTTAMLASVRHSARGNGPESLFGRASWKLAVIGAQVRNQVNPPDQMPAPDPGIGAHPPGLFQQPGLADDGYLLVPRHAPGSREAVIELLRLRDGVVVHSYTPEDGRAEELSVPRHPLLLADGGFMGIQAGQLRRFDRCGRAAWSLNIGEYHHSLERDGDGLIWAARDQRITTGPDSGALDTDLVAVTDAGRIAQTIPLDTVFASSGLAQLYRGRARTDDPFHVNDIEPVLADGPHWRRGDLFLSIRNLSMVALLRPSTGRIVWHRTGPWSLQHDVQILDDRRIAVFDNRALTGFARDYHDGFSDEVIVDLATGAITRPYTAGFAANRLSTLHQGRGRILPDGDIVAELTNNGRVVRMSQDGRLRWDYYHATAGGRPMPLGWTRYYTPEEAAPALRALAGDDLCRAN